MNNILVSLASHWIDEDQAKLKDMMDNMSAQLSFPMETEFIDWSNMWTRLSSIATHHEGPMLSEVGSTWVASFHAQNALQAFTQDDLDAIGGKDQFIAWEIGAPFGIRDYVAIPWMADSQVIYFWKDLLDEAGVDEHKAFQTFESFEDTLNRVSKTNIQYPLAMSTNRFPANLHQLASWVWGVDGEFLDKSGKAIRFLDYTTFEAIVDYFSLYRYVTQYTTTTPIEMARSFARREAAVTMGGIKIYQQIKNNLSEEDLTRVGVSLPPGRPFVGCESLVIWSHSPEQSHDSIIEVIKHLTAPALQHQLADILDLMPTRIETLQQPPYMTDPFLQTLREAINTGRSYPAVPVWGEIEDKLLNNIVTIWEEIFQDANPDIYNIVLKHLIRASKVIRPILA